MMASGGDTSEVGSSSQILVSTSIRPGTANKQPRSAIWLYFKTLPEAVGTLCCTAQTSTLTTWTSSATLKDRKEQILPRNMATCSGGGP